MILRENIFIIKITINIYIFLIIKKELCLLFMQHFLICIIFRCFDESKSEYYLLWVFVYVYL